MYELYKRYEPDLPEATFTWRIHNLKQKGIIRQVKRSLYSLSVEYDYTPYLTKELVRLSKIVAKDFTDLDYCISTTEWLNLFTRHQLGRFYYIIDVERDFTEDVFNAYCEIKHLRVLFEPNEKEMTRYLDYDNTVIIKPIVSRSPKQKISVNNRQKDKINVPTIEKLLVDVFCDEITFYCVQGREMETIFENAIRHYNINYTRLMSYARRRAKEKLLFEYMKNKFDYYLKGIL